MSGCLPTGWGTGPWGITPWGGSPTAFGGPLPTTTDFDLYCFGPCGEMAGIFTHAEVNFVETGLQFSVDGTTLDVKIDSGGGISSSEAALLSVSIPIPGTFTFEWTAFFAKLPPNFSALSTNHVYFGVSDAQGPAVGFFFSRAGIAYSGSIHTDGGALVLDGPLQTVPGSAGLITEGDYFTVRVAVSAPQATVSLYITRTADLHAIGHQLRFVLPVLESAAMLEVPPDQTLISVRGTRPLPSTVFLDSICLGSGLLIPNVVPYADAGIDQALVRCSVLELDGSKSFDPEGTPLTYRWRLIDAPVTSQYAFAALDGSTLPLPVPTGYTDRFYSPSLGELHGADPILPGDVLSFGGAVYVTESVGSDASGFFVRIFGYTLPDALVGRGFGFFRQRGLSGRMAVKPTFYPDVPGLYKFDLVVFDGALFSSPSTTAVNVTESAIARGITPDAGFLWNYLSDFWRLVEDRERIEVFWSGLIQIAAAELLVLWQIDYSKSLRDIERTFQRRWLHYDLLMVESLPELATVHLPHGVLESGEIEDTGVHRMIHDLIVFDVNGTLVTFDFSCNHYDALAAGGPAHVYLAALKQLFLPWGAAVQITLVGESYNVDGRWGGKAHVEAPFPIHVVSAVAISSHDTIPAVPVHFEVGQSNGLGQGMGQGLGPRTYRTDRSLNGLGLVEGDFLVLGGRAYRIARVLDNPSDPSRFQRVSLLEDIPVPAPTSWQASGKLTSRTLDFHAGLVSLGDLVRFDYIVGAVAHTVWVPALGTSEADPSSLAIDATNLIGLDTPLFVSVLRRTYLPLDPLIVDIPYLQEKIKSTDDTEVLRRNVDFFLEKRHGAPCLRFATGSVDVWQNGPPPERLWAETTYLDNRPTIEANFGIPADFTLDALSLLSDNVDYLSSVRGLWYAYFNGPTLFNLKVGAQILLGLPFAEEAATIEEVRLDFSPTQARLLLRDKETRAIVRSYTYPAALGLEKNPATGTSYKVGDAVAQFAPLVSGVDVVDWVKDPGWFGHYLQQGVFREVEKYSRFLVRVDSLAFHLSALLFVQSFIGRMKPTNTQPMFVVLSRIADTEVSVTDSVRHRGILHLYDLGVTDGALGMATMFDEPRAAGGGWRSRFDAGPDPDSSPTFPTADLVLWGADKNYLSPEDAILARCTMVMPHLEPPFFDSGTPSLLPFLDGLFRSDLPLYEVGAPGTIVFADNHIFGIPAAGYVMKPNPVTAGFTGSLNFLLVEITGNPGSDDGNYDLLLELDGDTIANEAVLVTSGGAIAGLDVAVDVTPASVLRATLRPATLEVRRPNFHQLTVTLYRGVPWALDTPLAAGTYGAVVAL